MVEQQTLTPSFTAGDISIVGVKKAFGTTKALDGCTFNASLGEIHAIFGGNGCGKSTLAKVISGVLPVDAGQVSILGRTPTVPHEAKEIGIATVFQEVLVADECSIVDNLFLGADSLWSRAMSASDKRNAARTLLEDLTGQELNPDMLAGELPLGLKQWIVIGRALLRKPKVLILDESSAGLDLDSTERLFAKIRELRDQGSAVIMVTHRIAEMIRICDRVTVLRDGRDVGILERGEITEKRLIQLMTGKAEASSSSKAAVETGERSQVVLRASGMRIWPKGREIDFRLLAGEVVGVAGLDGQGQSEFVRVLAGVDKAVRAAPQVISPLGGFEESRGLRDAVKRGIAYVSGDRKREGIFANLSIFENMTIPLYKRKVTGGKLGIINWKALFPIFQWERERLSIRMGDHTDKITSLSGGNQQKVLIGRAFSLSPNILVLNDPARGIDIGAKTELYTHLREFAAGGKSVIYMSSEIEELIGFCSRVIVFRNGSIFDEFTGSDINRVNILAAMFGQARAHHAAASGTAGEAGSRREASPDPDAVVKMESEETFALSSSAFDDGDWIPARFAEESNISPALKWMNPPAGTRSFALAVTDPDLPEKFNFPRAFAHWMIFNIPSVVTDLPEGASPRGRLPLGAQELESDFVTFKIPGYGKGYGGPWPPDAPHRYIFTLYALKVERLDIRQDADYVEFVKAVLPVTIKTATLTGVYGPASKPLPGS
jgi:ribose transport system ATP-binding protein